jgi:hypothetical protein
MANQNKGKGQLIEVLNLLSNPKHIQIKGIDFPTQSLL